MIMVVGLLKETESRVALVPDDLATLQKLKVATVLVEKGAGDTAFYSDEAYELKGAKIVDRVEVLRQADLLLVIHAPSSEELAQLKSGCVLAGQFNPLQQPEITALFKTTRSTAFSLELIPRTTRAQAMDVLSSMAMVSGYKAVLLSAVEQTHMFPMSMTAAGSIRPAKMLVLGAGVAGLQAIATGRRLGAVVEAFDVRAAAREEVESLGGKFVEVEGAKDDRAAGGYAVEQTEEFKQRQASLIADHASKSDVIICTAQIPGRKAPLLITSETIDRMKPGSVIVDLAASTGGNCAYTVSGKKIIVNGVSILGYSDLPTTMSADASKMLSKNMVNFLALIIKEGELVLNFEDDIVTGTCLSKDGEVHHPRVQQLLQPQ
ncbi:MAG: Re/Si-specific NAD(P)(+) transhydrogenase subunit alpha [Saprospiraceae bacterium]|nr:Re/Si-specific NAD(P)(+) transhydrogenase subunit alpha [Saprospiraceae bacterium]